MAEMTRSSADAGRGLAVALGLLAAWAASLVLLVSTPLASLPLWAIVVGVLVQTFLYTGLFITAHDGMHGTICPRYPRLNDAIGVLSVGLYALFDFRALRRAHHAHHRAPASLEDPDYHDGEHSQLVWWYLTFLWRYLAWWQLVGMAVIFNVLQHFLGTDVGSLVVFWVVPSLLSTLQLFVVGTWLPHRDLPGGHADVHRARTLDLPPWLSLLACYHFGYHHEHHDRPAVPWWRLPQARRDARSQTG
ncbi:MAG: beta-carotene ketolase (CrtW type) [Myxococcota bacterium]